VGNEGNSSDCCWWWWWEIFFHIPQPKKEDPPSRVNNKFPEFPTFGFCKKKEKKKVPFFLKIFLALPVPQTRLLLLVVVSYLFHFIYNTFRELYCFFFLLLLLFARGNEEFVSCRGQWQILHFLFVFVRQFFEKFFFFFFKNVPSRLERKLGWGTTVFLHW
jgi:hypothetical protein